ncbi:MAG: (d)CMP kinase [Thioploca sp.]|nr:(d)CMP kinase [Thioploca sp.]
MSSPVPVITLDGPSGVGKGTVSLRLAKQLGWHTLDSGALYRVLALAAVRHSLSLSDESALADLAIRLNVYFKAVPALDTTHVFLAEQEVSAQLRTEIGGAMASQLAILPAVRQSLLKRQRAFRQPPGLIAEGRDMGTVVFNDAPVKIFLTANPEERAQRRYKQLKQKGIDAKLDSLITEIAERDNRDMTRTVAPLLVAADAEVIDTTDLSIEQVVEYILQQVSRKIDS